MYINTLPRHGRSRFAREGGEGGGGQGGTGGAGGQSGAGQGGAGGQSGGGQGDQFTPITSQEALNALIQDRVRRAEQKGFSDAETKYKPGHERAVELQKDLASETEKAVLTAKEETEKATTASWAPRVVKAEFKAAAKGVLSDAQLSALLEDLDLSKYLTSKGEADDDKIANKVKAFAPGGGGGGTTTTTRPVTLGQGNQTASGAKKGDAGRAEAQRRFGKPATAASTS